MSNAFYLGLDLSTQQLKGIVIDDECQVVANCAINFAKELPAYKTDSGVHRHSDGVTITSPVHMWLDAIDLLFEKLAKIIEISKISAISGCGQQHGTVYWNREAEKLLGMLNEKTTLSECLKDAFATDDSPIWMDSSTTEECAFMEAAVGGPLQLATITGSRAFHRFSGNQIMKMYRKRNSIYQSTKRISLVSSFVPTVLCGRFVGIDVADAAGMNILDLKANIWHEDCVKAIVNYNLDEVIGLEDKLGEPIPCQTVVGKLARYFCSKYGFSDDCEVVAFTGDNLSSLAGLCLESGDIAVSLGTSDTVFLSLSNCLPALEGHLFRNPIDPAIFMGMLCFKNGSFTRNRIRQQVGANSWEDFAKLVLSSPPGNQKNIGFYFDDNEIVPNVSRGDYRFSAKKEKLTSFPKEVEARAVLEHQCLAKRLHAEKLGYRLGNRGKIFVTGGASSNSAITQILADVFNCEVYARESSADSAALGGALRARHVHAYKDMDYFIVSSNAAQSRLISQPNPASAMVYDDIISQYAELEKIICS